jgi:hypothetical protein
MSGEAGNLTLRLGGAIKRLEYFNHHDYMDEEIKPVAGCSFIQGSQKPQ